MSAEPEPRKRTRVACDTCRKKKIRCDGQPRCQNCAMANEKECHYEVRPLKKPKHHPRPLQRNMDALSMRLLRVESVLMLIADRFGAGVADQLKERDELLGLELATPPSVEPPQLRHYLKQMESYMGSHSFLIILLQSSIEWMEQQLGPDQAHLMEPFVKMLLVLHNKFRHFISKWIDQPVCDPETRRRLQELPFPKNSATVYRLLDHFLGLFLQMETVGDIGKIRGMFDRYYSQKRSFRTAELLIMTSALLYCLVATGGEIDLSEDELWALQDQLLTQAIFYYQRLCVVGDGLETVEAMLMFLIYLECSCVGLKVNNMVLALAVRFAKDVGLHRAEMYENISAEESDRRKRMWWKCYYLDLENCFRSGKPPLISKYDVSPQLSQVDPLTLALELPNDENHFFYFFSLIVHMRSLSYERFFSATATFDTFKSLLDQLDALNAELFSIAGVLPEHMRPLFANDPKFQRFENFKEATRELHFIVHLTFFTHLMTINRLPLLLLFDEVDEAKKLAYRSLALNCARTVLEMFGCFGEHQVLDSFYSWFIFYPLIAFLHLLAACMNNPQSPEAYADLQLLINAAPIFLRRRMSRRFDGFVKWEISYLVQVLYKMMMRIVLAIHEKRTGIKILEFNETLKKEIELSRASHPELFGSPYRKPAEVPQMMGQLAFSSDERTSRSSSFDLSSFGKVDPRVYPVPPPILYDAVPPPEPMEDLDAFINSRMVPLPHSFFEGNMF